jgi:aminoglycoside phosphotransferase (APT) family kinase protein
MVFSLLLFALLTCASRFAEAEHSPELEASLEQLFPEFPTTQLMISSLGGGYSQASNYKIENKGGTDYVLRLYPLGPPAQEEIDREFYMMTKASQLGVAPHIHGITENRRAILAEFITEEKFSLEQIKQPAVLQKIGEALRLVHSIPRHSHPTISIRDKYEAIYQRLPSNDDAVDAISIIRDGIAQLHALGDFQKNIHGELHPRNVFVTEQNVLLIDWAETTWADPLYDLSYFVLLHDLSNVEEQTLLRCYLGHEPTAVEKKRYALTKKINLAGVCLVLNQLLSTNQDVSQRVISPEQRKDWSYYVQLFSSEDKELSSQFFHGWAITALEMARE